MSKLDELRRTTGGNVAESMGKGVTRAAVTHGASALDGADRWTGLERLAGAQRIPVERITRDPSQPREVFDPAELAELAASIRARGVLQPIRVRWDEGQGMYVVIAGERRLRATREAGRADVPCVIHDGPLDEAELLLDQLAENLIRLDLEPIEQARAFKRLMDANTWSARRLADELHIDHDKVNRAIRLLELPTPVQSAIAGGDLSPTTAFEVSKLTDPEHQRAVADRVIAEGLSRAEAAVLVRQTEGSKDRLKGKGATRTRARNLTSKVLKTSTARVTVELRRGDGLEALLTAVEEAAEQLRAMIPGPADLEEIGRGMAVLHSAEVSVTHGASASVRPT